jgi:hypothetical protein
MALALEIVKGQAPTSLFRIEQITQHRPESEGQRKLVSFDLRLQEVTERTSALGLVTVVQQGTSEKLKSAGLWHVGAAVPCIRVRGEWKLQLEENLGSAMLAIGGFIVLGLVGLFSYMLLGFIHYKNVVFGKVARDLGYIGSRWGPLNATWRGYAWILALLGAFSLIAPLLLCSTAFWLDSRSAWLWGSAYGFLCAAGAVTVVALASRKA